ncbi:MAG: TM2 domain-containing protein [Desulfurellales bacterium]|nr:MAG: TM2 domain-containing protein [Desulfurellales bacterium]
MKFYEKKIEEDGIALYHYTVTDVFGTIVIASKEQLKALDLDTIVSGIMQSGFSGGQIREGLTFDWEKAPLWSDDDEPTECNHMTYEPKPVSSYSRGLALILCIVFGALGVHRFYLGRYKTGLLMLGLSLSVFGIIVSLILSAFDALMILVGGMHDAEGKRLAVW